MVGTLKLGFFDPFQRTLQIALLIAQCGDVQHHSDMARIELVCFGVQPFCLRNIAIEPHDRPCVGQRGNA